MDTKTQLDRLTELTILHRSQLRELAGQLPGLREEIVAEFERRMDEAEPQFRQELEAFAQARTEHEVGELSRKLKSEIDSVSEAAQKRVAKKMEIVIAEKKAVRELMKKAHSEIKGALKTVPEEIETVVGLQADAIREETKTQLETHFAVPRTINPRGVWKKDTTYEPLDLISYNGSSYIANVRNRDVKPGVRKEEWTLIARRGPGGGLPVTSLSEIVGTPTDGQILIADNGNYVNSNLTAGYGINITEGAGSIEIATSGFVVFKGTWNAATNTPSLASGVGTAGNYYVVSTAGSTDLDGITDWQAGDWAIFNGTAWEKVDNSEIITSVNGQTGVVVITKSDVGLGNVTDDAQLKIASDLADLNDAPNARGNLGLGDSATLDVGTISGTVAAGDDSRLSDERVPTDGSVTDTKIVAGGLDPTSIDGTAVITTDSRLSDARTPTAHAASHVDGTDDIRDATASLKGLATAAQISKLDGIDAGANVGITELTGDVTAGPGGDSQAATLASTGVAAASYGSATQVGSFTVDVKGRLTAASDVTITPAFSSITSKPTTLSGYGITDGVNTSELGAANGVATLDSGSKLTSSQLPDIAVTEYLGDSANEAAMLALTGQQGDWTTRTDLGTVWIITGTDPSVIGGWTQLSYPTAPVTSVAGKTGAVTLDSSDVGLGNVTNDAQLKIASNLADLDNVTTARDNLGLGTMATQDANAVAITGGSATGLTSLGVVDNTTLGSSNTDTVTFNARAASEFTPATDNTYDLGRTGHEWRDLYLDGTANIDSLVADTADINGGTIDGTTIGATTPAAGTFSQVNSDGAIIAVGAGSFGDDTDVTGDFTVTGSVGIGTAGSPEKKLHIASNATSQTTATIPGIRIENLDTTTVNTDVSGEIEFFSKDASETDKISGFIKNVAEDAGTKYGLSFGAKTNGSNATEAMRINHAGDVGIGLTNPAEKLSVAGGNLNLDDNYSLNWSAAPGRPYIVGSKASDFIKLGTPSGGDLLNLVSTSVGIGTAAPSQKLDVNGYAKATGLYFGGTNSLLYEAAADSVGLRVGSNGPYAEFVDAAGVLEFGNAGGSLHLTTVGTPRVYINTSGAVGVGTASPSTKLSVATATNGGISVNDGTVNGIIYGSTTLTNSFAIGTTTNHPLIFGTNNSFPQMTLATSGNVGVGETAPTAKFVVSGGGAAIQGNGFPTTGAGWEFYTDTTTGSWAQSYSRTSSAWLDANWNALTHKYSTAGAERMRITSSGAVGIGTTAPSESLDVNGNFVARGAHSYFGESDTTAATVHIYGNSTGSAEGGQINIYTAADYDTTYNSYRIDVYQSNLRIARSGHDDITLNSAGTFTMSGRVIMGGTALPSGTSQTAAWDNTNKYIRVGTNVSTTATLAAFYNSNGAVGTISTSGTATAYNTSSDYRLKENVVPMQDALQRITQLKPSRFNFIADDSVVVDGFIAHEVQAVVPEAISGEKDAMRDEEYEVTPAVVDDDGNEITAAVMGTRTVPDYQGIDQSKLVPLLVGAVQELTARLEALENN
jgi:hypothetical protein